MKSICLAIVIGATFVFAPLSLIARSGAERTVVLDVRTPQEFNETRVVGATNIDFLDSSFKDKVSKLDRSLDYKVYCKSGNRAGKAIETMKSMGFMKLENLGSVREAAKALDRACEPSTSC